MTRVEGLPVDRAAGAPQLAERLQRMVELPRLTAFRRQRCEHRRAGSARTVLPRERLQRAARPDLEQHQRPLVQVLHAFREAHGLAQLTRPIRGIDGLLARDHRSRQARDPGLVAVPWGWRRGPAPGTAPTIGIHRGRMKRVRGLQPPVGDRLRRQLALEPVDGLMRAGNDHQSGRIVGRDADTLGEKIGEPRRLAPSPRAWRPMAGPAPGPRASRPAPARYRARTCRRALPLHTRRGCARSVAAGCTPHDIHSRASAYSMTNRAGCVNEVCFSSSAAAAARSGAG